MKNLKKIIQLAALAIALFFSLATSVAPPPPPPVQEPDDTWLVANLFDGQTGVPTSGSFELTIGYMHFVDDFAEDQEQEIEWAKEWAQMEIESIALRTSDTFLEAQFTADIYEEHTVIHYENLLPDSGYELEINRMGLVERFWTTVHFSTKSDPMVTGVWITGDTLVVTFSEYMDVETLNLAHDSIDILWESDGDLHSIASDLNLADYVWEADELAFRIAPIDTTQGFWVKVAGDVKSDSGEFLDGNRNGIPGEAEDDYLEWFDGWDLPICFGREDLPQPCVNEDFFMNLELNSW